MFCQQRPNLADPRSEYRRRYRNQSLDMRFAGRLKCGSQFVRRLREFNHGQLKAACFRCVPNCHQLFPRKNIRKDQITAGTRQHFAHDFQALCRKQALGDVYTGGIAIRPTQICDQSALDWVVIHCEKNHRWSRRILQRPRGLLRTNGENQLALRMDQFASQSGETLDDAVGGSLLERNRFPMAIAKLAKTLHYSWRIKGRLAREQNADLHRPRLRVDLWCKTA